jgi:hypothetical protein
MRIQVRVDGWPFIVEGSQLDIERGWDEETVMVRGDGPVSVQVDQEELARQRAIAEWVWSQDKDRAFMEFWNRTTRRGFSAERTN